MLRRVFVASALVRHSLVAAMLVLVAFASASVGLADGSVALVVGNSTYAHTLAHRPYGGKGQPGLGFLKLGDATLAILKPAGRERNR